MKFKLISVDGSYTGILNGNIFVSSTLTKEQLVRLTSEDVTAEEIIEIFSPKLQEIRESNKQVQELVDVLLDSGLFEERNGVYYRVGNPISVPKMLLEKYRDVLVYGDRDKQLEALDNFWLKCSLNPNVYARENLFEFLQRWEFVITQKGYVVTYRNANIQQEGNKELHDFIATNYTKIKGQKKAPKNYTVFKPWYNLNTYSLHKERQHLADEEIGNLQDLYNNLSSLSETVYTDAHSGTTRIRIGEVVSIPLEKCDLSQNECSAGLHTASSGWLKKNYYGSVGLVCLVNPMNIVSVPKGDYGKMRSSSYLPIGLAEYDDNGKIIPVATDIFEDDYDTYTIEELNKLLQEVDSSNQVIHQLTFSEVPNQAYRTIDEYRTILESKNQSIYGSMKEEYEDDDDCDYDYDDEDYGY